MAYWLAPSRDGQEFSYIQRFDPRFWTVNFPRPAMASVITTGPDSLQVDVELHHEGELVGLIWDSEDTLDHPLLAYQTDRDYSFTALSFRWVSEGVIPLDEVNGPTLTIEGYDELDQPRTWFVRLWNYAEGSPEDAFITIPFSELEAGFVLPGEAVVPTRIDRLFISIVPPGFVADSTTLLPQRVNGRISMSEINVDGARAMLEIGDVRLPVHGERMATAYDDAYDQTPARLLRSVESLGYREDLVHYVGMSHYMRLERQADDTLMAGMPAELCVPCSEWHRSFFEICAEIDLEAIASISYELFDEYCPEEWKQRTSSGEPALTGWVPPSTLLSPAHSGAMLWLQSGVARFVLLQQGAGLPVRMQIGEPWWWTTFDTFEICLYDDAARDAFGGSPPLIADMREPLDESQIALLDEAGALLAQSTSDLTAIIQLVAQGSAEVLLLAFTPTILSAETPEAYRANLPIGWARPAFDRLQLEDYDWLTAGMDALRRAAYEFVDNRLGYPIEEQDYLSGFVLDADDAEEYWERIDAGLDEAKARGVARRYVWALPQVARDGYTRLAPNEETTMQAFDDVLYPFELGRNTAVAPEFSTTITVGSSGHERRNSLWSDALIN
ncbi:MAG: TIGR02217 family protein, partial [Pseudomonadota bacterium]